MARRPRRRIGRRRGRSRSATTPASPPASCWKSLPAACELVTVDHHRGDRHSGATSPIEFLATVAPFAGDRPFQFLNEDFRDALADLDEPFGFVFYDADHTAQGVADFWHLAHALLDERCLLVYDDGDWPEQATLGDLAGGGRVRADVPARVRPLRGRQTRPADLHARSPRPMKTMNRRR